jgi:anti-sigma factor RsiW
MSYVEFRGYEDVAMNCELAHERVVMAIYGELPDDAAHELDRHLVSCAECQKEREQLRALKLLADAYPLEEPAANLLARSRLRLEEALDALPPKTWLERVAQRIQNNLASLQAAPLAAGLLLAIGAGAGGLGGYHIAQSHAARMSAAAEPPKNALPAPSTGVEVSNVSSISSIVHQPNSEQVEVRFNQLVPAEIKGSLDDPEIRQLLMMASANSSSPGVRDDSVELLAAECRAGHSCRGAGIRDALMVALRYDRNEGVRQKALEGLQPYVAEDVRVRDAVLEALLNDSDPRIRTAAINILEPVEADTSVRQVLHTVANSDRNPQIRLVSRQVLSREPAFQ